MKKIVFLLCLAMLMIPTKVKGIDSYPCNNGFMEVREIRYENGRKAEITKIGENAFKDTLVLHDMEYYINDVICTEDRYVLYGYTHGDNYENYYDDLLVVYNFNGEKLLEERTDYGELEEITDVFYMNQTYYIVVHQTYDNGHYEHLKNLIEVRDNQFNIIETIDVPEEVFRFKTENDMLILQYEYVLFSSLGIKSDGGLVHVDDPIVIEKEYYGSMTIEFLNEARLNNEIVENGVYIEYPGNYEFIYDGFTYEFVVHPLIKGVEDKNISKEEVLLEYSAGNGMLDNDSFISGTRISDPGNHLFIVNGINEYSKEIEFTISASVEGITNGHTYENEVKIEFNGDGYLNNNHVTSPLLVSDIGDYILTIKGANGYLDMYEFSVVETDTSNSLSGFVKNLDIFLVVIVVIMGVIVIKKK